VIFKNEKDIIVTIKNPFAWFVSIHNYSKVHNKLTFHDFLRSKYTFEGLAAINPIIHWNTMNSHWSNLVLQGHKLHVARYEDLLIIPEKTCDKIATALSFEKREQEFKIARNYMNTDGRETASNHFHRTHYTLEKFMDQYTKEDLDFVYKYLDRTLLEKYYPDLLGENND